MITENLIDLKQAREFLNISKETLYRLIYRNKIPFYKVGKLYRFKQSELDRWISEPRRRPLYKMQKSN